MQERLERLERQVRWTRAGLVLVGLAALASWARPDREVVRVRDAEGRVRIELGWNEVGQPGVFLYDEQGLGRGAFEITKEGCRLALLHKGGESAAELEVQDTEQHGSNASLDLLGMALLMADGANSRPCGTLQLNDPDHRSKVQLGAMGGSDVPALRMSVDERTSVDFGGPAAAASAHIVLSDNPQVAVEREGVRRAISTRD